MAVKKITWEQFAKTCTEPEGIRFQFESLCRQLFVNEFLSKNIKTKNVHCNPNNAGLESDPVYDEENHRWIGYQAKFFDTRPGYDQILHSAKKTVERYSGKVDHVFLFCNKQLSVEADNYKKAVDLLKEHNISLEPITGDTILDQVRKYQYLAEYYFGCHPITREWIVNHNKYMFGQLGNRFNQEFNVDTEFSRCLSLFVRDDDAIKYINEKKAKAISDIEAIYDPYIQDKDYLDKLKDAIESLISIEYDNIEESFCWEGIIQETVKSETEKLKTEKEKILVKQDEYFSAAFKSTNIEKQERDIHKDTYYEATRRIRKIESLIDLQNLLNISDFERRLITNKCLAITGNAGVGKSQMMANEVKSLNKANRDAILFLAGLYLSDESIQEQIIKNCSLDFSFDELIDIFEAIGERQQKVIPVMIDALNETWYNSLWKTYLPVIIDKIESCNYVKLVFSFRDEYEELIMSQTLIDRMRRQDICHIAHRGFEKNSIEASKQFFDYHEIPFTLFEYFKYEMSNPLFLTLYCRAYKGDEVDLPTLYERIISCANESIHKSLSRLLLDKGYCGNEDLLTPFINEMAAVMVNKERKMVTKEEINSFAYWNNSGIAAQPFMHQMLREQILYSYPHDEEWLYFSYDQMNDYFCAKAIIEKERTQENIRKVIIENILEIKEGKSVRFENRDLFVSICVLYAEKFGEECIDVIDLIDDDWDKEGLFNRYIESYQWRNRRSVSDSVFLDLIDKYKAEPECVWKVLIGNSIKVHHPLNAYFLHDLLKEYELNKRDYIWTTYINTIFSENNNRLVQLIKMYEKGKPIFQISKEQTTLLLILFGWLLTSSDRMLRDHVSKAMVEILKDNFDLSEIMLRKFEKVNDPYVIQRLYGVIFGACCKRVGEWDNEYRLLAEYVYTTIFDKKYVFPDILLRDYARLIIERFLWEQPEYTGIIERNKITPPYESMPIPVVSEDYTKMEFEGGIYRIATSMKFEKMGMYGDFGRYVFQSALHNFDIDDKLVYNYAMSFIINDLGYENELFGEFDSNRFSTHRHITMKVERIGKKYQWIAMYNILARVSDNYKMRCRYSMDDEELVFEGAWEPYVRDFDPTLNYNFVHCDEAPIFKQIDDFLSDSREEHRQIAALNIAEQKKWLNERGAFLANLKDTLILTDNQGLQWVSLTGYIDTGRKDLKNEKLLEWSWLYAYFVKPEQKNMLLNSVNIKKKSHNRELYCDSQTYVVFNREYPWSPSCKEMSENEWIDISLETGEKETVIETRKIPDWSYLPDAIRELVYPKNEDVELEETYTLEIPPIEYREVTQEIEKEVKKPIGRILKASDDLIWEEEFDASNPESLSWSVLCVEMINEFKLRQLESDCFYYDMNGELAAFDMNTTQGNRGVAVRKDLLDEFLKVRGLELIWALNASKEIHPTGSYSNQYSEWSGILSYNGIEIEEKIYKVCN